MARSPKAEAGLDRTHADAATDPHEPLGTCEAGERAAHGSPTAEAQVILRLNRRGFRPFLGIRHEPLGQAISCLMVTSHVPLAIRKNEPDSAGSIGIAADVSVRLSRGVHPSSGEGRRAETDGSPVIAGTSNLVGVRNIPARPNSRLLQFHHSCSCSGPACGQARWEPPLQSDMVSPEGPATFTPARADLS